MNWSLVVSSRKCRPHVETRAEGKAECGSCKERVKGQVGEGLEMSCSRSWKQRTRFGGVFVEGISLSIETRGSNLVWFGFLI